MGRGPMQSAAADLLIVQRIGNIIQNHRQNKLNRRDEREFTVHAGVLCDCWNNRRRLHVVGDDNSFRREEERLMRNLPESNPVRMEDTRRRNMMLMQVLKEAAEPNENISRSFGK